jgi:hypothetical protein
MRAEPVMKAGGETQVTKAEKVKTRHALRDTSPYKPGYGKTRVR